MKYLIDTVDKQVGGLARQYKNLKQGDEYLIYDPNYCNIEGKDFIETVDNILENGEFIQNKTENDNDPRRFKFTIDFEKSLDWCDCYVCFVSIPFILGNWGDLGKAQERVNEILGRIEKAKSLGKKIYLGNTFSEEFDDIARNYENSLNTFITEKDLEDLDFYNGQFQSGFMPEINVTMVVGVNSSCGKFSSALKVKKQYEELGEKVCLIHTEESYPFLDDQGGTIYGFCRNFSDLTTDQDLEYLQCLVSKIVSEQHPDRIIFVTQAGIGIGGVLANYPMTKLGKKMKGVWDILIDRSFGLNSVVICSNWDRLLSLEQLIAYYNVKGTSIDGIYISPVTFRGGYNQFFEPEDQTDQFYLSTIFGELEEMRPALRGLAISQPKVPIYCDYGNLTQEIKDFKESEGFKDAVLNKIDTDYEAIKKEIHYLLTNN